MTEIPQGAEPAAAAAQQQSTSNSHHQAFHQRRGARRGGGGENGDGGGGPNHQHYKQQRQRQPQAHPNQHPHHQQQLQQHKPQQYRQYPQQQYPQHHQQQQQQQQQQKMGMGGPLDPAALAALIQAQKQQQQQQQQHQYLLLQALSQQLGRTGNPESLLQQPPNPPQMGAAPGMQSLLEVLHRTQQQQQQQQQQFTPVAASAPVPHVGRPSNLPQAASLQQTQTPSFPNNDSANQHIRYLLAGLVGRQQQQRQQQHQQQMQQRVAGQPDQALANSVRELFAQADRHGGVISMPPNWQSQPLSAYSREAPQPWRPNGGGPHFQPPPQGATQSAQPTQQQQQGGPNNNYRGRLARTFNLTICLPVTLPGGTVRVTKTSGENFYEFPDEDPSRLLFSCNKGVCDIWASFLEIKLGMVSNVRASDIALVVRLFHAAMRAALPSGKRFLLDRPIRVVAKGLKQADNHELVLEGRKQAPAKLETRGFLESEEDVEMFKDLALQLRRFIRLLAGKHNLVDGNDDENLDAADLAAQWKVVCNGEIHPMDRSGLRSTLTHLPSWVLDPSELSSEGFPIIVREWGDNENDLAQRLMRETDLGTPPAASGLELAEVRLEHQSKKMVDPRFDHGLVLTRQMAGDENPEQWGALWKQQQQQPQQQQQQPQQPEQQQEDQEAKKDGAKSAVEERQGVRSITWTEQGPVERSARYVFAKEFRFPAVHACFKGTEDCLSSKHGFIYMRHLQQSKSDQDTQSGPPVVAATAEPVAASGAHEAAPHNTP